MTSSVISFGEVDTNLTNKIQEKKQSILDQKKTTLDQIKYIKLLDLSITKDNLDISDKGLEKLRLMCQLWDVELRPREIQSHRKIIGPIIVAFKKAIFPILKVFLKDYVRQQKDFNSATISLLGEILREQKSIK